MISQKTLVSIGLMFLLQIVCNDLFSQSTTKTKKAAAQQPNTIIILGDKSKSNKNLQDFQGFYSGLNLTYFKQMSEAEKAILGYIATFAQTECFIEDSIKKPNGDPIYNCKLTLAIGIGYQCSDQYLAFERNWFRNDSNVLNDLKECHVRPSTASTQSVFDLITLSKQNNTIKIYYKGSGVRLRENKTWEWSETLYFNISNNEVRMTKRITNKTKVKYHPDWDKI